MCIKYIYFMTITSEHTEVIKVGFQNKRINPAFPKYFDKKLTSNYRKYNVYLKNNMLNHIKDV